MQINIRTLLLLFVLAAASCSKAEDSGSMPNEHIDVTIGSYPGIDIETRSTLDPDGVTVNWTKGDAIAVWARNNDGVYQFSAQPFVLWHFGATYNDARFSATIDPMPAAAYDYLAITPIPAAIDGTQASYPIPTLQTGVYNDDYDIRVATPALGKGPLTEGDNSASVNFAFAHKVHMLKIRIPKNLLGVPITEIELTFPVPVTGTLTVDAADPNAVPVLTEGSNILTIKPETPLEEGSSVLAFIAPVEISDTEKIEFRAYSEQFTSHAVSMSGKNFAAGRTTPIALNVPTAEYTHPSIQISLSELGENTLGENIHHFKITSVAGSNLGNDTAERSFDVKEAGEIYTFYLGRHFDPVNNLIAGQTFNASYESENAIVSKDFVMPATTEVTKVELAVPYLLEEDFSRVAGFSNHDNAGGNVGSDKYTDAIALDTYGLPGWSGTRCGAEAGNAFRICSRTDDASFLGVSRYHGRLDTPPIPIRPGKTVQVSVSFDYSINISWSDHKPLIAYGYHTTPGLIKSVNSGSTALTTPIASDVTGSGGSYSSITQQASYTIPACTNAHRLAWDIYSANRKAGTSNGWLYLDNIQVKIVK